MFLGGFLAYDHWGEVQKLAQTGSSTDRHFSEISRPNTMKVLFLVTVSNNLAAPRFITLDWFEGCHQMSSHRAVWSGLNLRAFVDTFVKFRFKNKGKSWKGHRSESNLGCSRMFLDQLRAAIQHGSRFQRSCRSKADNVSVSIINPPPPLRFFFFRIWPKKGGGDNCLI